MWERFKKWWNVDHVVDLAVDMFLLLFEVITSPILIVMRLARYLIGEYVLDRIKSGIKRIINWLKNKPRWVKFVVIPVLLFTTMIILIFVWIFGKAWGEFIMEEFGGQDATE